MGKWQSIKTEFFFGHKKEIDKWFEGAMANHKNEYGIGCKIKIGKWFEGEMAKE